MANNQQAEKGQVRSFSFASPTVHPITDVESGRNGPRRRSPHDYLPTRRSKLCCCGCCGATVLLLGVTILVLALTVFKVKDPEVTMNNLHLDRLFVPGIGTPENPISVNATLTADISIKNPNVASFRFRNSTTEFFYEGVTVGAAYAPDGYVKARRTARMNVTVDVMTDRVVLDTNATAAVVVEER
ncbi:hypothetical protein HPP92_009037 [Vanilla planifolia]|uniref:Late embryogenesis abundant protein LEA-2 subgroup domain-containing protein n=1 Tax=Vanilla planifolia TaxID=51239 RepID=A0A835V520_VANPL|nr:hypothetical protein HPP92_009037 [Vanilla planifolia]